MDASAFRVASVRGIDVRLDVSWLLIAALVTWSYWERFDALDRHAGVEAFVMAVAAAALFFGSLLAHELAHALEAQRRGVHVRGITLFLFGGVTETRFDVRRPVDEFALTAVGPFTSFVVAATLGLVAFAADQQGFAAVGAVAGLVAWINLALGAFNLLPGAPLDGGRILRAAVWHATGDRQKAVVAAGRAGQALGGALLAVGFMQVFFVPVAFTGGVWLALIGWFLFRAASAEVADAGLRRTLGAVTVRDLIDPRPPLREGDTLAAAVDRFQAEDVDLLAVESDSGTVGIIDVDLLRSVPHEQRPTAVVRDAMVPAADLPAVEVDEPAAEAVDRVRERGVAVARAEGQPVGIVTAQRISTVLRRARQFGESQATPA